MDGQRFDTMTKTLAAGTPSRRRVLRALAGGVFGLTLARLGWGGAAAQEAAARRCQREGKDCTRDNQCCSGVCKRRTCRRAPGQGTCQGQDFCVGLEVECNLESGFSCRCFVTTHGTSFCGALVSARCSPCTNNADCDEVTGAGSVCVRAKSSGCFCDDDNEPGGRACVAPCPDEPRGRGGVADPASRKGIAP